MEGWIFDKFEPKISAIEGRAKDIEHRVHNLERKFDLPPKIDVEITGNSADFVIENARKVYESFGARTNFNLKVILNEVTQQEGE